MVHQENVSMIITLVHEIPGDCDEYFPNNVGEVFQDSEMIVELVAAEQTR